MAAIGIDTKTIKEVGEYQPITFKNLKFCSNTISTADIKNRMDPVLALMQQHPEALKLLNDELQKGAITVEFCPTQNIKSTAVWNYAERKIYIIDSQTEIFLLLDSLVFELCNANNSLLFEAKNSKKTFLNLDQYLNVKIEKDVQELFAMLDQNANQSATLTEEAEYHTANKAAMLESQGIEHYNWPKPPIQFEQRKQRALETYLKDAKTPSLSHNGFSHFQSYVKEFYEILLDASSLEELRLKKVLCSWENMRDEQKVKLKNGLLFLEDTTKKSIILFQNINNDDVNGKKELDSLTRTLEETQKKISEIDNNQCDRYAPDIELEIQNTRTRCKRALQVKEFATSALKNMEESARKFQSHQELFLTTLKKQEPLYNAKAAVQNSLAEKIVAECSSNPCLNEFRDKIIKLLGENPTIAAFKNSPTEGYDAALPILDAYIERLNKLTLEMKNKKIEFETNQSNIKTKPGFLHWAFGCCRKPSTDSQSATVSVSKKMN